MTDPGEIERVNKEVQRLQEALKEIVGLYEYQDTELYDAIAIAEKALKGKCDE